MSRKVTQQENSVGTWIAAIMALSVFGFIGYALLTGGSIMQPSEAQRALEREKLETMIHQEELERERADKLEPIKTTSEAIVHGAVAVGSIVVVIGLLVMVCMLTVMLWQRVFPKQYHPPYLKQTESHPVTVAPVTYGESIASDAYPTIERKSDYRPLAPIAYSSPTHKVITLSDVVTNPTLDNVTLALKEDGTPITVSARALCHVAIAGSTGGGKSNFLRVLMAGLLSQVGNNGKPSAKVFLADPHFTMYDADSKEDWSPIANRLYRSPAVAPNEIEDTLVWLVEEMYRRLEIRRKGENTGSPIFLCFDELPAIVANVPNAPDYMARLLREGRKVQILLAGAAQDWLVKTIGGTGSTRDLYRTAVYTGGDPHTARILLDVKGNVDDGGLGKGVAILRSTATPKATRVKIPYASNESLYKLLPPLETARNGETVSRTTSAETVFMQNPMLPVSSVSSPFQAVSLNTEQQERVRQLVKQGIPWSDIIEREWNVKAGAGNAYIKAGMEFREILAKLV